VVLSQKPPIGYWSTEGYALNWQLGSISK